MVKKLFSISDEVAAQLNQEKNQSAFVDALLHVFFDLSPTDPGRQELKGLLLTRLEQTLSTDPPLPTEPVSEPEQVTEPEPPALVEPPTPLVETPKVPVLAQATSEPCEHGVTPPAVCIDCI